MNAKILDKIRKLKAHADSAAAIGSDAEAQAFAAMMQRMMLEHDLSMTDIEVEQAEQAEPVQENYMYTKDHGIPRKKTRDQVMEDLAGVVAHFHYCRILVHPGSNTLTLVGRESDAAVATYLIVTLYRSLEKMAHNAWWAEWKRRGGADSKEADRAVRQQMFGFKTSYKQAFILQLDRRLRAERKAVTAEQTSASTALMRIDRRTRAVDAWFDEINSDKKTKLRNASGLTRGSAGWHHGEGWRQGAAAADAVNLKGNAIKSGTPQKGLR